MPVRVKKTRHCEPLAVLIFLRDPDGNKVEVVCYRALCNVKLYDYRGKRNPLSVASIISTKC